MVKTHEGLVAHAKMVLAAGWGYVWGTFGQILTETLFEQKLKQYPEGVGDYKSFIKEHWLEGRTTDCVGLIKSYMWWDGKGPVYVSGQDLSANGMFDHAKDKGPLKTIPEIPGVCLWKDGHVGIYIGNGQVIEAHGTKFGVIQTPLHGKGSTPWTNWFKCPFIAYEVPKPKVDPVRHGESINVHSSLNIRSGPGTNHNVIGSIRGNNIKLTVYEIKKMPDGRQWARINKGQWTCYEDTNGVHYIKLK